jgi:fatty acid-binding protein DegV
MTVADPTNTDIMDALAKINARLDKGDESFREIRSDLKKMAGIQQAADTLVTVAQTWNLVSLGGRIIKWAATVLAAFGALWVFFREGPQ